jgi:hypothetical protein
MIDFLVIKTGLFLTIAFFFSHFQKIFLTIFQWAKATLLLLIFLTIFLVSFLNNLVI